MKKDKTLKFNKMYKYAAALTITLCVVVGISIKNTNKPQVITLDEDEKERTTLENNNPIQNNIINITEEKIEEAANKLESVNKDSETIMTNVTDELKDIDELPQRKEICYETSDEVADRYDLVNPIEVSENGRLFFTLRNKNIDITDLISTEISYVYEYVEDNIKHIVIVGLNSDDSTDYGYAEYLNDGSKYFSMLSSNVSFDENGLPEQLWLLNAINKLNINYKN